jgi:hypothetical protein
VPKVGPGALGSSGRIERVARAENRWDPKARRGAAIYRGD